jgi:hypothetical protein
MRCYIRWQHRTRPGIMRNFVTATLHACIVIAAAACNSSCATRVDGDTLAMVVKPSSSTTETEIASAIQDLISTYPVCVRVPLFRTVDVGPVNLDPAELKLGEEDAEDAFDAMVRLGYMTKAPRPDLGKRVFEFKRTQLGSDAANRGSGESTSSTILGSGGFCMPAGRKLVRIEKIGHPPEPDSTYVIVDFIHTEDPASVWAQNPDLRQLAGGEHGRIAPRPLVGRVLMSRVWLRDKHPLKGAPDSGALWAPDYDRIHNRWIDLRWGAVYLRP